MHGQYKLQSYGEELHVSPSWMIYPPLKRRASALARKIVMFRWPYRLETTLDLGVLVLGETQVLRNLLQLFCPKLHIRVCNRLSGYSGYSDIRKNLSVRIVIQLALLGKIDYWICSIQNNRFVNLHSEVLRYSSSATTIRPLFEYLFITISGYAFTILHVR